MRLPKLDERLQAAADLFTACDLGADIGADHGRLSCYLLGMNRCKRMIVSDISAPSLEKARQLLALHALADRADIRVSDGLDALNQKAGCAALCGMGGRLMADLLLRGKERLQGADLVLSCHTEITLVRRAVTEIGYHLCQERLTRAKGRYYIIMRAETGPCAYTEKELYLGPILMREKPALWQDYLRWRRDVVSYEVGHERQLAWIREELNDEKAADGSEYI